MTRVKGIRPLPLLRLPLTLTLTFLMVTHDLSSATIARSPNGRPIQSLTSSLRVGPDGPLLLQDTNFLETLSSFDRERIPERVVHALGVGAHGYFEVTHDITHLCGADLFSRIGKRTRTFTRFSTVVAGSDSADTAQDPRGFATKFYTEDGNWDLVGNSIDTFPIRDPIQFPSLIHSRKRHPQSHLFNWTTFWDFVGQRPESIHHTMLLFSEHGFPDGFRHIDGFSVHAFRLVPVNGSSSSSEPIWAKFKWTTNQGLKFLSYENATLLSGIDSSYATRDLFNAIQAKEYPSWSLGLQVMTQSQIEKWKWSPFDPTKAWYDVPVIPVGKLVLDRNPTNYFNDVEQVAFCPGNLVPGIQMSPDPLLQGRAFSYSDTQRYRLGTNFRQLPINQPKGLFEKGEKLLNGIRDGQGSRSNGGPSEPNYFPNSSPNQVQFEDDEPELTLRAGTPGRYDQVESDFSQPDILWRRLDERERGVMVQNFVRAISQASRVVQDLMVNNIFKRINKDIERRISVGLKAARRKK